MELECMAGARVVAGFQGMDRVVKGVSIMEVPDILDWVDEGILLLTTLYPLKDDLEAQIELPVHCSRKGLAALAVKPGRFSALHPQMLANAEIHGLPLIQIPFTLSFTDILFPVMRHILGRENIMLESYLSLQKGITEAILAGGNVSDIVKVISAKLQNVVSIHDENFQCLAWYNGTGDSQVEVKVEQLLSRVSQRQGWNWNIGEHPAIKFLPLPQEQQEIRYIEQPIMGGSEILGYLCIWELGRKLREADLAMVKQCATLLAIERLKFLASREAEKKYRQRFLNEWLSGQIKYPKLLEESLAFFDWNLSPPVTVVVIHLNGPAPKDACLLKRVQQMVNFHLKSIANSGVVGIMKEDVVVIWPIRGEKREELDKPLQELLSVLQKELPGATLTAGVGRSRDNLLNVHTSYQEAVQALRIGLSLKRRKPIIHYEDLGTYRVLFYLPENDEIKNFLEETLGRLLKHDREHGTELLRTLECYFENQGNEAQMAKQLFIHYNTVRNRLQRISEICQINLKDTEVRFSLELALKIYNLKQWQVG